MSADEPRAPTPRLIFPAEAERAKSLAADREKRLDDATDRERIQREARRRIDAEERGFIAPPISFLLREWANQPEPAVEWRIAELQPADTRVVLAAQNKSGKTTLVTTLIRSLVDGDPFLERYAVAPIAGRVALIDAEMPPRLLRQWLLKQRIQHADRVVVFPLRGQAASFDPRDPENRAQWAQRFREHEIGYVIVDCLRPVLDALGLDEHSGVGPLLVAFDTLLRDGGVNDAVLVHHMGHVAERSRGDSRLRDWPDCEWQLVRQNEDPASPRFFKAYGRDVHLRESALRFDKGTHRLTIAEGSRRDAATRAALEAVVDVLTDATEPLSVRGILSECAKRGTHPQQVIRAAIGEGIRAGRVVFEEGKRGAHLHRIASDRVSVSECVGTVSTQSEGTERVSVSAPIGRHTARSPQKRQSFPESSAKEPTATGRRGTQWSAVPVSRAIGGAAQGMTHIRARTARAAEKRIPNRACVPSAGSYSLALRRHRGDVGGPERGSR